jgi:hypothetical protein
VEVLLRADVSTLRNQNVGFFTIKSIAGFIAMYVRDSSKQIVYPTI